MLESDEYLWQYRYRMVCFQLVLKFLVDNNKAIGDYNIEQIINNSSKDAESMIINIYKEITNDSCEIIMDKETKEVLEYFEKGFKFDNVVKNSW